GRGDMSVYDWCRCRGLPASHSPNRWLTAGFGLYDFWVHAHGIHEFGTVGGGFRFATGIIATKVCSVNFDQVSGNFGDSVAERSGSDRGVIRILRHTCHLIEDHLARPWCKDGKTCVMLIAVAFSFERRIHHQRGWRNW